MFEQGCQSPNFGVFFIFYFILKPGVNRWCYAAYLCDIAFNADLVKKRKGWKGVLPDQFNLFNAGSICQKYEANRFSETNEKQI